MKDLRQVFLGIMIALASFGLILGAFSLSLTEGNINTSPAPTNSLTQTSTPTLLPFTSTAASPTLPLTLTSTSTPTRTTTWTPGLSPSPTNCPPPLGWLPYIVKSGDTLDKIAARYRISSTALQQANCLLTTGLLSGVVIYVPPVPAQTSIPCGPPSNWIVYTVQPGDTLYRLSLAYGVSISELQRANCMGSSTVLHTGQAFYVPPWGVRPPPPTAPMVPTATMTDTPETSQPSETPSEESTSTATETPVPIPSDTPTETPTEAPESITP